MSRIQVQRIAAAGPRGLPSSLLIDVGAITRWLWEEDPYADLVGWATPLLKALGRSGRRALWCIGPPAVQLPGGLPDPRLASLLSLHRVKALFAAQALTSLVAAAPTWGNVGIVSANLEERPYELWPLAVGISAMVDVATGIAWSAERVGEVLGPPSSLPVLQAIVTDEIGKPLVKEAARHLEPIAEALAAGHPMHRAAISNKRVKQALGSKRDVIAERAMQLIGADRPDPAAQAELAAWVAPNTVTPVHTAHTVHLAASVERIGNILVFQHAVVSDASGATVRQAHGYDDVCNLLAALPRQRWFMPQGLATLAAMDDAGLELPESVVDPALCAFALDPDNPVNVADNWWPVHALSRSARIWLQDHGREADPPRDLVDLARVLPQLDAALGRLLKEHDLSSLIEDDIARTLPTFARIERRGAWVGDPLEPNSGSPTTWSQALLDAQSELADHISCLREVFGDLDPARATAQEARELLKKRAMLVWWEYDPTLSADQHIRRLEVAGLEEAAAVRRIKSLDSPSGSHLWLTALAKGPTRLRGRLVPTTTGRFTFRDMPLHSLPKHSPEGQLIRSGLRGPPGYILIGADWNAFETRLLASLSRDPVLLQAAQYPDLHAVMAGAIWPNATKTHRSWWKKTIHSVIYGQTPAEFWKEHPEIPRSWAEWLYNHLASVVPQAFAYRTRQQAWHRSRGEVRTGGGWRRFPPDDRKGFATLIQGLGADILRWVLRQLERQFEVEGIDAFVVHQAHDEVFVATRLNAADRVTHILEYTMNAGVQASGLLPHPVPLPAAPKRGTTWLDLA